MADQPATPETSGPAPRTRLASIDAYRGFVMFLMMAEVLALSKVSQALPESRVWEFLHQQQEHVEWVGCVLHDLIQPSFSFLVGTALAFSAVGRAGRGESRRRMLAHAVGRALALIFLGVFLRSVGRTQTNFTFEDTLSQIGLGYVPLFLLAFRSARTQWITLGGILVGYWLLFAAHPLPGPGFDWAAAGVAADWPHHLTGFAAHWNKNTHPAWLFDQWFLNLWPREKPFLFNGGGYCTLSFIPTLATMILGLIAGQWLQSIPQPRRRIGVLLLAGIGGLALGWVLNATGVCPVVKRIWTPSWTLFSGGWCFLLLAAFHGVADLMGRRTLLFPLIVIGMNSIAAYCMDHLFGGFIRRSLETHLGTSFFQAMGPAYDPLIRGAMVFLVLWLILLWMHRRKLFLRL